MHFTLYSRSYCHLCDDMLAALKAQLSGRVADIRVVDVDADPALIALYDELVPVLMARGRDTSDQELCHYFLDAQRVEQFLQDEASSVRSG
ncbi:glutaredoxin family protein [Actimicrobium antarcticum]|uniref:glutaredoxin family protein n=1 Tax=Actimicrobium antarcticum TaxID=1051899 RepID=UPI003CD05823